MALRHRLPFEVFQLKTLAAPHAPPPQPYTVLTLPTLYRFIMSLLNLFDTHFQNYTALTR